MNLLQIAIVITSVIFSLTLALVVFLKNTTSAVNRLFAGFALLMAIESIVYFFSLSSQDHLLYIRLVMVNTTGIALLFGWLARYFITKKFIFNHLAITELAGSVIAGLVMLSDYGFSGVNVSQNGNIEPIAGPGIILFVVLLFWLLLLPLIRLIRKMRSVRGIERAQLRSIIIGVGLAFALSFISNFVFAVMLKYSGLVQFTPIFLSVFTFSAAIAIIRNRLFNIRIIIARSVAFTLLLGSLAGIYATGLFAATTFLFPGSYYSPAQNWVNISLGLILAFTFQPLKVFFSKITDQIFYRDKYDPEEVLNDFSKIIVSEYQLDRILKRTIEGICEKLHIQFGQLIILNNERVYRVEHYGKLPARLMVAPDLKQLRHPLLVADELNDGPRRLIMEEHGIRVSMTLHTREEFVGYLLLGDKLSGDIYSSQDIQLLEIIGKQLAVAILNAKAYAQIEEFNQTLQARVDHATSRLRVANRHLKELDKAKDEFISMASHQLRTPLTTIKGYLSMMLEGDAGKLNDMQKEFVGYAFGSSERMVNLIADLLNVSRLSAGRFLIQTKPTDIVAMVADEVRQLETHASAKNLQLIFHPPKEPLPLAEIDDNKTRQVIMNFIDNAIYYTKEGSVTVQLEQTHDCIRLEVRDTGIGVPEEARKKLFSKFFRAGNAQTVRPDGTGLGLYLAKRVVEDQGGTIIFSSVEGKGSTFGFELPLKPVTPIREVAHAK